MTNIETFFYRLFNFNKIIDQQNKTIENEHEKVIQYLDLWKERGEKFIEVKKNETRLKELVTDKDKELANLHTALKGKYDLYKVVIHSCRPDGVNEHLEVNSKMIIPIDYFRMFPSYDMERTVEEYLSKCFEGMRKEALDKILSCKKEQK